MAREEENPRWNVPATPELDERVRERIQRGGFTGLAEYVRSAVRADLERDAEKLQVCVVVNTTGDVAVVVDAVLLIGMPVTRVEFLSVFP